MSTTVTIPVVADYREATLAGGEANFINSLLLIGNYLWGGAGMSPGKLVKIDKANFSSRSVLTFASDGRHNEIADMTAVGTDLYILFNNPTGTRVVISKVDTTVTPLAYTDVVNSADFNVFGGSITNDGTNLYVLTGDNIDHSRVLKYVIGAWTRTVQVLTNFQKGQCIRYDGVDLYASGSLCSTPDKFWLKKLLTTDLSIAAEALFDTGTVGGGFPNIALSANHIFLGVPDLTGNIFQVAKSDLSVTQTIATNIATYLVAVLRNEADLSIWCFFDNGKGVRINPDTLEQRVYTLNADQIYISEMVGESTYLYTTRFQAPTIVSRYNIPIAQISGSASRILVTDFGVDIPGKALAAHPSGSFLVGIDARDGMSLICGSLTINKTQTNCGIIQVAPEAFTCINQKIFGGNGGIAGDATQRVATDSSGNIYVTGAFYGTCDFGGGANRTAGGSSSDAFCAKYNSSMVLQWVYTVGQLSDDSAFGLAIDSDGHILLGVTWAGTNVDFGNGISLSSGGVYDSAIIRLNSSTGATMWAKKWGGSSTDDIRGIATSGSYLYAVITSVGGGNFGGTDVAPGIVLAKYNLADGTSAAQPKVFGDGNDFGAALIFADGNLYMAGGFRGTINFGGDTLSTIQDGGVFLVSFDTSLVHRWSFGTGAAGDVMKAIVYNPVSGSVYWAGQAGGVSSLTCYTYVGQDRFDPGHFVSGNGMFLLGTTSSGNHLWCRRITPTGGGAANSVIIDSTGKVLVCGNFAGASVDFGDGTTHGSSFTNQSFFLAQYAP